MSAQGALDLLANGVVSGWARLDAGAGPATVELCLDGRPLQRCVADRPRADLFAAGYGEGRHGFECALPAGTVLRLGAELSAWCVETGQPLANSPLRVDRELYAWGFTTLSDAVLEGWICHRAFPPAPVMLSLMIDGQLMDTQRANLASPDAPVDAQRNGFRFMLPAGQAWKVSRMALYVAATGVDLMAGYAALALRPIQLELMQRLARLVRERVDAPRGFTLLEAEWLLQGLLREGIDALRADWNQPLSLQPSTQRMHSAAPPRAVTVILPVYRDLSRVEACLDSLLHARNRTPLKLLAVDDASPEAALSELLRQRAAQGQLQLLSNEHNLGFAGAVNRAIAACPGDEVVVLNADTEVTDGWLDRLLQAARADPGIGTASPFSNRASIFSLFRFGEDTPMPLGLTAAAAARLCAAAADGQTVDVPTTHGFCMLIRRACLDEIGELDAATFGRGYGEENDFCLRASRAGWRHVLVADAFVEHHGAASFGEERHGLLKRNLELLGRRWPDYRECIAEFYRRNPVRRVRAAVLLALWRAQGKPVVLLVTHALEGGTEVTVQSTADALAADGLLPLILRSGSRSEAPWTLSSSDDALQLDYLGMQDYAALIADLSSLPIRLVHIHHLIGFPLAILKLPDELGVPRYLTLHDYLAVCPRITLLDPRNRYCGLPEQAAVCERCVKLGGAHAAVSELMTHGVAAWRQGLSELMQASAAVFVPSEDTAQRIGRVLPDVELRVLPPFEPARSARLRAPVAAGTPVQVALLGSLGAHKGFAELRELLTWCELYALPLRFTLFGRSANDSELRRFPALEIIGKYEQRDIDALLAGCGASVALFLSVWPETWSHTLTEALRNGLRPVAYDLGAPAARLRAAGVGRLLPLGSSSAALAQAIQEEAARVYPQPGLELPGFASARLLSSVYGLSDPQAAAFDLVMSGA